MILDTVALVRLLRAELHGETLAELEAAPVLVLSAASLFEINQKVRIGRLDMAPFGPREIAALAGRGVGVEAVTGAIMARAASMEWLHDGRDHRDPFGRIIAATALEAGLPVVTSDRAYTDLPGLLVVPLSYGIGIALPRGGTS